VVSAGGPAAGVLGVSDTVFSLGGDGGAAGKFAAGDACNFGRAWFRGFVHQILRLYTAAK